MEKDLQDFLDEKFSELWELSTKLELDNITIVKQAIGHLDKLRRSSLDEKISKKYWVTLENKNNRIWQDVKQNLLDKKDFKFFRFYYILSDIKTCLEVLGKMYFPN